MEIWKEKNTCLPDDWQCFSTTGSLCGGKRDKEGFGKWSFDNRPGLLMFFLLYRFFCMDNFSSSLPDHYTHLSCIFEPSLTMFRFQPLTNMRLPLWIYLQEPAILIQVSPLAARPCSFFYAAAPLHHEVSSSLCHRRIILRKFLKSLIPSGVSGHMPFRYISTHFFLYSNEYRIIIPSLLDVQ